MAISLPQSFLVLSIIFTSVICQGKPLARKGDLILDNNFAGSLKRQELVEIKDGWQRRVSFGEWSVKPDGSVQAVHVPEHGHGPVLTFIAPIRDIIIECEFKLPARKGPDQHFRIFLDHADYRGHNIQSTANLSSTFRPVGLTLQHLRKNQEGENEANVEFGLKELNLSGDTWYKMRLEVVGDKARTVVNGITIEGQNPALDVEKSKIGLNPGMAGGSIRNFKAWLVKKNTR